MSTVQVVNIKSQITATAELTLQRALNGYLNRTLEQQIYRDRKVLENRILDSSLADVCVRLSARIIKDWFNYQVPDANYLTSVRQSTQEKY